MLEFPINKLTFPDLIDGDGSLSLSVPGDAWTSLVNNGQPFPDSVASIAELNFSANPTRQFRFGNPSSMKLNIGLGAEAIGSIQLIRGGSPEPNQLLKIYDLQSYLDNGNLYAAISLNAHADAAVDGSFQIGALSPSFGIKAGINVGYDRLVLFKRSTPAGTVLKELLSGVRLPQQISKPADIPAEGEVIALNYGGYLKLQAGLSYGLSISGSQSFEVSALKLALDYQLRLIASLSVGYSLAGNFSFEARRGHDSNWARVIVRKKRDTEFNFAFDLSLGAELDLKGLPESPDAFLEALLGTNVRSVLNALESAREYTSWDALEAKLNGLVGDALQGLSDKYIGKVLNNATFQEFLAVVRQVVDVYDTVDQKIIDLYSDFLGSLPELKRVISLLKGITDRSAFRGLSDSPTWKIVERLAEDKLYDILLNDEAFLTFKKLVEEIDSFVNGAGPVAEHVRTLVQTVKERLKLESIFDELRKYDTPEKLKNLVDKKLQALVEKIIGKAFKEIKASEFGAVVTELNAALNAVEDFKNQWYAKLSKAARQSFEFDLNFAYTRATADEALLDIELDLSIPEGQSLLDQALAADFSNVIKGYNRQYVRIHRGILTHSLTRSAQLKINVLGWEYRGLSKLVQNSAIALETHNGGLVNVYTLETQINQLKELKKGGKLRESVQSNFLLRAIGEVVKPSSASGYVFDVLRAMSSQYELQVNDQSTTFDEMRLYLELAEFLGLVPDRERMLAQLKSEFPRGLGKVSVKYVVRYDENAIRGAFTFKDEELRGRVRMAMRKYIAAKYTGMKTVDWIKVLGFAYLDPEAAQLFAEGTGLRRYKSVFIPKWAESDGFRNRVNIENRTEIRSKLYTLFSIERNYVSRLYDLDVVVDKAFSRRGTVDVGVLEKAARNFVDMADDLDQWRENAFFVAFDKLVRDGNDGKNRRMSAMILEITPPGSTTGVRKYLME